MSKLNFDKEYLEIMQESTVNLEEYQYWLGLKERTIYFNQEVDMGIINRVVYWIIRWNEEDKDKPVEELQPIKLYVSSNGGCVVSGLALIDAIQTSRIPVETIGVGVCASMGALLLLSGTKGYRKCYENTTILLHDGNLSLSHSGKKARQVMDYYDGLEDRLKDITVDKTVITSELYDKKNDEEWYLFGSEALELGIVDEIIK
ncbi:ATP-dependent Clp protease proteolytic subunit [Alkalihalophilus pseudofirmus]|uniref:ClpP family protease n=1 Tax=Alkalihalophilus pseudofirmus TaxID=79885 RepID=UPI00259BA2B3|nr:ATP-dependent Clp protease proteolytic subunit [Alkalihalophilus pseudofirmus]WEG18513.1 ATP-dependent Clp protease proteolytic subunit [Alkalihalophilus pseudofirmus]